MIRKIFVLVLALALVAFAGAWAVDKSKVERITEPITPEQGPSGAATHTEVTIQYDCNTAFVYTVPDGVGDTYEGMRFNMPGSGKLTKIIFRLQNSSSTALDTINDVRLLVTGNDPSCDPPGVPDSTNVLLDVIVPNAFLVAGPPGNWNPGATGIKTFTWDISSANIILNAGDVFHVSAMTAPGNLGANRHILDDGSCTAGAQRWVEWGPGCACPFHAVDVCFPGNDLNLQIRVAFAPLDKVPSLTTYGLVGLTVLLLATGIWMFRKKIAPVNAPNLG